MPKISVRASVLDGLADVVSYERDPSAFYLRVYVPGERRYRQTRLPGAHTLQEARQRAAGAYRQMVAVGPPPPKRGTKPGTKQRPRKNAIGDLAAKFLALQDQRAVAGEIAEVTLKGKREVVTVHLLPFCEMNDVRCSADITIDTFKGYPAYRSQATPNTKRKEQTVIQEFLSFLIERDALRPEVAAKRHCLLPKIKKTGEDNTANPPIAKSDWLLIETMLDVRCIQAKTHPNPRTYYSRRLMQVLLRFLMESGLRPNEARALRWKDIEFSPGPSKYFHGERTRPTEISEGEFSAMQKAKEKGAVLDLLEVPSEIVFIRVLKSKTGSIREVACDCATLLRNWRLLQEECASSALTDLDLVFSVPTKHGETPAFSHNSVNIYWRKIIESLGDRLRGPELSSNHYTPYSLRHSRAVYLIDCGVGVYEAAKMLGHSVQTFESFYAPYLSRKSGASAVVSLRKVD